MKKKLYSLLGFWVVVLLISLSWNIKSAKTNQLALVRQTAKTLFEQMVVARKWNAAHKGVYVKVTDHTQPNKYLKDSQRDFECGGIQLTKINPSFMTRQISELTNTKMAFQFHVSSLNPILPGNSSDPWEKEALEWFSKGKAIEKGELFSAGNSPYYMYMKGLKVEQSCLECHTTQNYQINDVIGGISVKIHNPPEVNIIPIVLGHTIIGAIGFIFLLASGLQLIKAYKTIQHQAVYDALTNIPNRRYFNDQFSQEVKRNKRSGNPLSIIMADIDNFKSYNDNYGHDSGDAVLTQVATAIDQTLRRSVDFCARFGGEEFIVVLPDTDKNGVIYIADQILKNISALSIPHDYSEVGHTVSISLGIACKTEKITDPAAIIKKADEALYKAKNQGKNRYELLC